MTWRRAKRHSAAPRCGCPRRLKGRTAMPSSDRYAEASLVVDELRRQLARHGLTLPSLRVDAAWTGECLVQFGGVPLEAARRLIDVLGEAPEDARPSGAGGGL